jgi:hypothetical protein
MLNMRRVGPLLSLGAALAISLALYRMWVRRGRPSGVTSLTSDSVPPP